MEKVKGKPVISERERLKKDRDDWEQAKYDVEEIKDNNVLYTECLEKEIAELKKDVSIVNKPTDLVGDCERMQDIPKQIKISDYTYAFLKDKESSRERGFSLMVWSGDDWNEVSDLTMVYVFEYQEIKSYAVAIGWITEEQDLFI